MNTFPIIDLTGICMKLFLSKRNEISLVFFIFPIHMLTYRAEAFVTSSMAYLLHPLKSNITKTENIIMKYGCNVIF